jgi:LuxR family transcriptional regulator, quorum-sensing system regulator BjaR1
MTSHDRLEKSAFDFIDQLEGVDTADALLTTLFSGLSAFGFSSFLITGLPAKADVFGQETLLNGWPSVWYERYIERRYYDVDPVAVHARNTVDPFYWSDVSAACSRKTLPGQIMCEAAELGLDDGLLVPVYGVHGEQYAVTMAGQNIDRRDRAKQAIHLMAFYAHSRIQRITSKKTPKVKLSVKLSTREQECLQWVAVGKSDWEVSEILGISVHTANAHIRNASAKLDTVNRTHTVVKAMQQRLITL